MSRLRQTKSVSEYALAVYLPPISANRLTDLGSRRTLIRRSFPKIRIVTIKGERFYQVDGRRKNTNGRRETFKSRTDAEKRARDVAESVGALGSEGINFPTELRVMAQNCASRLQPFRKTL